MPTVAPLIDEPSMDVTADEADEAEDETPIDHDEPLPDEVLDGMIDDEEE